jgi:hypothetical protein
MVATGPNTSYPTNFSAVVDWTLKQQCYFTITVCVPANSDVMFSLTELKVSKPYVGFNLHIVHINSII